MVLVTEPESAEYKAKVVLSLRLLHSLFLMIKILYLSSHLYPVTSSLK